MKIAILPFVYRGEPVFMPKKLGNLQVKLRAVTFLRNQKSTPLTANFGIRRMTHLRNAWTPNMTIKGGASGFYSIGVRK